MILNRQKYWVGRICSNGWDKAGKKGAVSYLKKYGRNISDEKIQSLAELADENGCHDLAAGFREEVPSYRFNKTWKETGYNSYSVSQKRLHELIKQDLYEKTKSGKPLIPTHSPKVKLKASNFALMEDTDDTYWIAHVGKTEYIITSKED